VSLRETHCFIYHNYSCCLYLSIRFCFSI